MRYARLRSLLARAFHSPWVLFSVACLLRLVVAGQLISANPEQFYRTNEQARIAWCLVSGHGFSSPWPNTPLAPTAQQPPVYPFLLAGVFRMAGVYTIASLRIALFLNAIFSSLTAVLIYRVGRKFVCDLAALIAAWVWACWLYEIVLSAKLWESSLSAFLLMAGLWLFTKITDSEKPVPWLAFGMVAGLAALTNTTLLAVFGCLWIWICFAARKRNGVFVRRWIASVAICVAVMLPWIIRNYLVFHRLIPVRDNFGLELWIGNHPGVTHLYDFHGGFPLHDPSEYNRLGELPFMETQKEIAFQFIRHQPLDFLRLCGQRFVDFWSAPPSSGWAVVSVIAGIGLVWLLMRKGYQALPLAIAIAVYPLVYYVTHPWSTYRHPIEPVLLLCAAFAVQGFVEAIGSLTKVVTKAKNTATG